MDGAEMNDRCEQEASMMQCPSCRAYFESVIIIDLNREIARQALLLKQCQETITELTESSHKTTKMQQIQRDHQ